MEDLGKMFGALLTFVIGAAGILIMVALTIHTVKKLTRDQKDEEKKP